MREMTILASVGPDQVRFQIPPEGLTVHRLRRIVGDRLTIPRGAIAYIDGKPVRRDDERAIRVCAGAVTWVAKLGAKG